MQSIKLLFKCGFEVFPSSNIACEDGGIEASTAESLELVNYPFASLAVGMSAVVHKDKLEPGDLNRVKSNLYRMNSEKRGNFKVYEFDNGFIEIARLA